MHSIEVLDAGMLSTIQDNGRFNAQFLGIPVSGAIDSYAFSLANLLVGNQAEDATIEFCLLGPTIKFHCSTFIVITGGNSQPLLDDAPIKLNKVYKVNTNSILKFQMMTEGRFGYLAIKGGILIESIFESKSTTIKIGLGGWHGRKLRKGDQLPIKQSFKMHSLSFRSCYRPNHQSKIITLRFVKGPQWSTFSNEAQNLFISSIYTVSLKADRMGYRLNGPFLQTPTENMLSEGTVMGNIQITRSGQPIVLLADRQTAGGYPVIGTICFFDLDKLVQASFYQKFIFKCIPLALATKLFKNKVDSLKKISLKIENNKYSQPIGPQQLASRRIVQLLK